MALYGGIAAVARATGIAASTIGPGLKELATAEPLEGDKFYLRRTATAGGPAIPQ